jgi:hypothetical protein
MNSHQHVKGLNRVKGPREAPDGPPPCGGLPRSGAEREGASPQGADPAPAGARPMLILLVLAVLLRILATEEPHGGAAQPPERKLNTFARMGCSSQSKAARG